MNQCKECLRENRIATANGPTCPHHRLTGAHWWPEGWEKMGECERIRWLEKPNTAIRHGEDVTPLSRES